MCVRTTDLYLTINKMFHTPLTVKILLSIRTRHQWLCDHCGRAVALTASGCDTSLWLAHLDKGSVERTLIRATVAKLRHSQLWWKGKCLWCQRSCQNTSLSVAKLVYIAARTIAAYVSWQTTLICRSERKICAVQNTENFKENCNYQRADKSLARRGRKQATATKLVTFASHIVK